MNEEIDKVSKKIPLGISIGNTFTGVAKLSSNTDCIHCGNNCDMVPDEDSDLVYPSVVYYPENGFTLIGTKAKREAVN